jgi:hypothetical protein
MAHYTLLEGCMKCIYNKYMEYQYIYLYIYKSKFLFASLFFVLRLPSYLSIYVAIHTSNDALNHPAIYAMIQYLIH